MQSAVVIAIIVAIGSLSSVALALTGRAVSVLTLFGLAAATIFAVFLVTIARAEGPAILIVAVITGISGLALVVTPSALLLLDRYQANRNKATEQGDEPRGDESRT